MTEVLGPIGALLFALGGIYLYVKVKVQFLAKKDGLYPVINALELYGNALDRCDDGNPVYDSTAMREVYLQISSILENNNYPRTAELFGSAAETLLEMSAGEVVFTKGDKSRLFLEAARLLRDR